MKKMMLVIAALAVAGLTQADIMVNGDFSSTNIISSSSGISSSDLGGGWQTYTPYAWKIAGGETYRDSAVNSGSARAIAQLWENASDNWYASSPVYPTTGASAFTLGAGSYSLSITYNFNDVIDDDTLTIQLFSYDYTYGGGSKEFRSANAITTVNDLADPATSDRYTVTTLIDTTLAETTGSQTVNLNFTLAADQEFMGIRFLSGSDATDTLTISNVEIVPEPATVGMLGLGALISLLVRRIRA